MDTLLISHSRGALRNFTRHAASVTHQYKAEAGVHPPHPRLYSSHCQSCLLMPRAESTSCGTNGYFAARLLSTTSPSSTDGYIAARLLSTTSPSSTLPEQMGTSQLAFCQQLNWWRMVATSDILTDVDYSPRIIHSLDLSVTVVRDIINVCVRSHRVVLMTENAVSPSTKSLCAMRRVLAAMDLSSNFILATNRPLRVQTWKAKAKKCRL